MESNITNFQKLFKEQKIDSFLLPINDEFLSEYVSEKNKRLNWLTGFSGSFAVLIITQNSLFFFTDARYSIQAKLELLNSNCEIFDIAEKKPWQLANEKCQTGIWYDPKLFTQKYIKNFSVPTFKLKFNPVDLIWHRENTNQTNIYQHKLEYAGVSSSEKCKMVAKDVPYFFTNPESICWLLNIRGNDTEYTPIVLCRAILYPNCRVRLFIENKNFQIENVESHIEVLHITELENFIKNEKKIALDPDFTSEYYIDFIGEDKYIFVKDKCTDLKACKNQTEIDCAITAHKKDGKAVTEFLSWIKNNIGCTEQDASDALLRFRKKQQLFQHPSFKTISAFGPNGAIVHYHSTEKTNARITRENLYLFDSGGQYLDGTTDVTRTICLGKPSDEQIFHYTIVLKAHMAIASAVFPVGTTGRQLDALARVHLWKYGLNYGHGTGHGVGSFLNVHEGPQSLSNDIPLAEGMILSNEPGLYFEQKYGIRLENLMYVAKKMNGFLCFKTLTLVPFQDELINFNLLTEEEKTWLRSYYDEIKALI